MIGLGSVGLPLAVALASEGMRVLGVDVDGARLAQIKAGQIPKTERGLDEALKRVITSEQLSLSTRLLPCPITLVAIPSVEPGAPHDHQPLSALTQQLIEAQLPAGALILIETTCAPGTTRAQVVQRLSQAGHIIGQDTFIAHCPERISPGSALAELRASARVIGGATPACAERARSFYARFVQGQLVTLSSLEAAESVKLIENASREVNIALVNELASWSDAMGLEINELLAAANTHPRVQLLAPGLGVGGRCLPLASGHLIDADRGEDLGLIRRARQLHQERPEQLARQVLAQCQRAQVQRVAILGLAYKPENDDWRASPSVDFYQALSALGGGLELKVHDPYIERWPYGPIEPTLARALDDAQAVVILTAHPEYVALRGEDWSALTGSRLVFDLCRALPKESLLSGGWDYRTS